MGDSDTSSDAGTNSSDKDVPERIFHVQAVPPQDLTFTAPPACAPGHKFWVQGPHGLLQVVAPEGAQPGRRITVRLAAPWQHVLFVPVGAKPGDRGTFVAENDKQCEAVVPPGKKPGETFQVGPLAVMLPVPLG